MVLFSLVQSGINSQRWRLRQERGTVVSKKKSGQRCLVLEPPAARLDGDDNEFMHWQVDIPLHITFHFSPFPLTWLFNCVLCVRPAGLRTPSSVCGCRLRSTATRNGPAVCRTANHHHRPAHNVGDPNSTGSALQRLPGLLHFHHAVLLPAAWDCCPRLFHLCEFNTLRNSFITMDTPRTKSDLWRDVFNPQVPMIVNN